MDKKIGQDFSTAYSAALWVVCGLHVKRLARVVMSVNKSVNSSSSSSKYRCSKAQDVDEGPHLPAGQTMYINGLQ